MLQIHTKDKVKLGLLIAIALYFLAFLVFNMEPVQVDFVLFSIHLRVFFLILFSALVGAGLVLGFSTLKSLRRPREASEPCVESKPGGAATK